MTSPGRSGDRLPDTELVRRGVTIDRDDLAAYAEVCGFALTDTLPATYLHMLAFPLSVQIMAGRDFPFVLAGLVHVRNRITHHRPVRADEVVDIGVRLADLRPHPKGRQFDVIAGPRSTASWCGRRCRPTSSVARATTTRPPTTPARPASTSPRCP